MNYEEKYKRALERARVYHTGGSISDAHITEVIFPELKESEDEITKNEIIAFVEQSIHRGGGTPIPQEQENKWLEWLEKQGEPFDDNIITRDDEILQAISIGLTDAEKDLGWSDFGGLPIKEIQDWLEKQGEHKPIKASYTTIVETGDGGINALVKRDLFTDGCYDEKNPSDKVEPKTLNADKVIAWLVGNIIDFEDYVRAFKQDFGLC